MKATAIRRVNTRLEANTASKKLVPLEVGDIIDVAAIETGENIRGNNLWLRDRNNNRFTAAGFALSMIGNNLAGHVDFPGLWNFENNRSIKIGIYDGGVLPNAELFGNRVRMLNHTETQVINFHGSYMATIIGGADINNGHFGFLRESSFFSFLASKENDKNEAVIDIDNFLNGLQAFLDEGVDIVNISMSTSDLDTFFKTDGRLRNLLSRYQERDIIIVASAGNEGTKDDTEKKYPAALQEVFSVAGCTFQGDGVQFDARYNVWSGISLLAPSFAIYQPDYYSKFSFHEDSGTSVSCAVLSGAIGAYKLKYLSDRPAGKSFKTYLEEQFSAMPTTSFAHAGLQDSQFKYLDFSMFQSFINL